MKRTYKYGIELECFINQSLKKDFATTIKEIGFTVGEDGSVRVNDSDCEASMEIRSTGATSYKDLKKNAAKLSEICETSNVQVNKSCGYHLHVSHKKFFNSLKVERILKLWIAMEDFLFATQPQSRFNNTYCLRKIKGYIETVHIKIPRAKRELITHLSEERGTRYYALNLTSLKKHGTIEVRLHAGTINKEKIINWIDLLTAFYDYAISEAYSKTKVEELFQMTISDEKIAKIYELLALSEPLKHHFNQRMQKFQYKRLGEEQEAAKAILKINPKREKLRHLADKIQKQMSELTASIQQQQNIIAHC